MELDLNSPFELEWSWLKFLSYCKNNYKGKRKTAALSSEISITLFLAFTEFAALT